MTKNEALKLLKSAPQGDTQSRVNPALTQAQVVKIVENGLPDGELPRLYERRVWQVVRNQKRPRF